MSDYRRLINDINRVLVAKWLSAFGDSLHLLALPIVIYNRTGSARNFALALAAESLPWIIVAPLLSGKIEKFNPKHVMIFLDIVRACACLVIAKFASNIAPLLLLAFLMGSCTSIFTAFRGKLIAASLDKAGLSRIVSVETGINKIISLAAPTLGGGLLLWGLNADTLLLIDAATYLVSAFLLYGVAVHWSQNSSEQNLGGLISNGYSNLKLLLNNAKLRPIIMAEGARNFAEGIFTPLLIVVVVNYLQQSSYIFAWSRTAMTLAEVIVSFLLYTLYLRVSRRKLIIFSTLILSLAVSILPTSSHFIIIMGASFFLGAGTGARQLIAEISVLNDTTGNNQGQAIASYNAIVAACCILGNLVSAEIASWNLPSTFLACGILTLAGIAPTYIFYSSSRLKEASRCQKECQNFTSL